MSTAPKEPGLFGDPAARNYLFVGLAAQFVVAAALLTRPSSNPLIAAIPPLLGVLGLVARLSAMPLIFLIVLCYLMAVPTLTPFGGYLQPEVTARTHFRLTDLVLVAAVLVYFAAQYRLLGLTDRAMPNDAPSHIRKRGARPIRRTGDVVDAGEFGRVFAVLTGCLLAGQIVWFVMTEVRVDFTRNPPVAFGEPYSIQIGGNIPARSDSTSRFLLLIGVFGTFALLTGVVFWYWRLARLTPARARLLLLDTEWREERSDLNRQEKWRAQALKAVEVTPPKRKRATRKWSWATFVVGFLVAIGASALVAIFLFCLLAYLVSR